jgi:hypothetical protein
MRVAGTFPPYGFFPARWRQTAGSFDLTHQRGEANLKIALTALLAAGLLAAAPAFAFSCPNEMKAIDAALAKNPKLSAPEMADVKKLRAEGEAFHKAGKHQESMDALAKAKKILKI